MRVFCWRRARARLLALSAVAGCVALAAATPADAADFFRGKTLNFVINFTAGGPTDLEGRLAAKYLARHVAGAPNIVRGGSHSGNASARELAEAGELDILSSDYVPGALLMAAFRLADAPAVGGLPGAIRLVSKSPAAATGLRDRGEIAPGLRADLLRVSLYEGEPVVRAVWREGRRVA